MKVLVSGAGGFLGSAIARQLAATGHTLRGFSRQRYEHLEALGVEQHTGDLADADAVAKACAGCDAVMHVAAKAGVWGTRASYHAANTVGTQHVLDACRRADVRRLVFTSSPSVTFRGRDESGVDESQPYPAARAYLAHYPATKAAAERAVLAANGAELATVALRPHLIWGPGDPHLVPRVLERARAGRLRLVGSGDNRVDATYIDNAAAAHVAALERLGPDAACAGKAYFISNGEPLPMRELLNRILAAGGLPPVTRSVSPRVAYAAGVVLEGLYHLLRRESEPMMTRFVARQLATEHWYDITAARRDLGYSPAVSMDEGMRRLAVALRGEAT